MKSEAALAEEDERTMVDFGRSRRAVLKSAGVAGLVGLSGCLDDSRTDAPSGRRVAELSVSGLDPTVVSITATRTRSRITADQTAQFQLTVTGQREEPTRLVFGNHVPFSAPQYSSPPGLLLLPANAPVERRTRRTWVPKAGYQISGQEILVRDLAAGETVTGDWAVWGDPEYVSFIESGSYDFETHVGLESSEDPIPWTLTVTVDTGSSGGN